MRPCKSGLLIIGPRNNDPARDVLARDRCRNQPGARHHRGGGGEEEEEEEEGDGRRHDDLLDVAMTAAGFMPS